MMRRWQPALMMLFLEREWKYGKSEDRLSCCFTNPACFGRSHLPNYPTARSDTCSGLPHSYRREPRG